MAFSQDQDALESRIQSLEDEREIRALITEYGRLLDTRDFEGFSKLFAAGGSWSGNIGEGFITITGQSEIFTAMNDAYGGGPQYDPGDIQSVHIIDNIVISVDGDLAHGLSKWTVMRKSTDNRPVPLMVGHYEDTFVREGGVWKILSRIAPRDIPSQDDL